MKIKKVTFYETAKGEMPEQSAVVLVWNQLLGSERCKFLDGEFYMSNGKKWLTSPLSGVVYWCDIHQFKKLIWQF